MRGGLAKCSTVKTNNSRTITIFLEGPYHTAVTFVLLEHEYVLVCSRREPAKIVGVLDSFWSPRLRLAVASEDTPGA